MYPVFYDIIAMKQLGTENIAGFELPKSGSGQQKRAFKKALNLNGGNDDARFELFERYYEHLHISSHISKICYLISSLDIAA